MAPAGKFEVVHFLVNFGVPMDNFGVPMENFGVCFPERCGCPRSSGLRDREKPKVIGPLPLDIPLLREKPGGEGSRRNL